MKTSRASDSAEKSKEMWPNKLFFGLGHLGLIPGLGRSPGRKAWQATPVFLPGESQRQRSLAGYSPWGHKESDTTERLSHPSLPKNF